MHTSRVQRIKLVLLAKWVLESALSSSINHLVQAIGNACVNRLIAARYYKTKKSKVIADGKEQQFIKHTLTIPCLIIDEVGYCKSMSQQASNVLFQILDARYDKHVGCTVSTSNKMPSEWRDIRGSSACQVSAG